MPVDVTAQLRPPPSTSAPSGSTGTTTGAGAHEPALDVVDVHTPCPLQPLPSWPRQPSRHVPLVVSQMRPEVAAPQSVSFVQPEPASSAGGTRGLHVPAVASVEEHFSPTAHVLPPVPRQPGWQVFASLQMTPDVGPPHVASVVHSVHVPMVPSTELHVEPAGQAFPPEPRHPGWQVDEVGLQTWPDVTLPHVVSERHCTHLPMVAFVDVHTKPAAQPLPPVPRQPAPQVFARSSQTLPLVVVPHVTSVWQSPHLFEGGQMLERQSFWATHG